MSTLQPLTAALILIAVAACGSSESAPPTPEPTGAAPPAAAAPEPAPEPAIEMADYDLSSADARWQGWIATAPAGARVMQDGVNGARIAAGGRDGFDLAFKPAHRDLAQLRRNLETGAQASNGEVTLAFTEATDDRLVWTSTGYGSTTYGFTINYSVGDREVSCSNNIMMGLRDEAALAQHQAACQTLRPAEGS